MLIFASYPVASTALQFHYSIDTSRAAQTKVPDICLLPVHGTTLFSCGPSSQRFSILSRWAIDDHPHNGHVFNAKEEQVLKTAIQNAVVNPEDARAWAEAVSRPMREDTLLALVIPALPNLQRLDLTSPEITGERWTRIFGFGIGSSSRGGPLLSPKLKHITPVSDKTRCTHVPYLRPMHPVTLLYDGQDNAYRMLKREKTTGA